MTNRHIKANNVSGALRVGLTLATAPLSRLWYNSAGARADEVSGVLPGDELVANPIRFGPEDKKMPGQVVAAIEPDRALGVEREGPGPRERARSSRCPGRHHRHWRSPRGPCTQARAGPPFGGTPCLSGPAEMLGEEVDLFLYGLIEMLALVDVEVIDRCVNDRRLGTEQACGLLDRLGRRAHVLVAELK